jgi:hypothetical protein
VSGFVPPGPALADIRARQIAALETERAATSDPKQQRRLDRQIRKLRDGRWWTGCTATAHW